MERKAILAAFWRAVAAQEKDPLREFFAEGAEVLWPNTNERFAVEEYLRANCEYPGKWHGKIEKMLDTAEGRAKFCRGNETSVFRKPDPEFPGYKIWVFNNQGVGMVVKRRSRVDPQLMEDVEYDADGNELSRSYEPA